MIRPRAVFAGEDEGPWKLPRPWKAATADSHSRLDNPVGLPTLPTTLMNLAAPEKARRNAARRDERLALDKGGRVEDQGRTTSVAALRSQCPEQAFTFAWNGCSPWSGLGVHFRRNAHREDWRRSGASRRRRMAPGTTGADGRSLRGAPSPRLRGDVSAPTCSRALRRPREMKGRSAPEEDLGLSQRRARHRGSMQRAGFAR